MTGLTEADIQRVKEALALTCYSGRNDTEQDAKIIAALRDETDCRMLLDVARQDLRNREDEILNHLFPRNEITDEGGQKVVLIRSVDAARG